MKTTTTINREQILQCAIDWMNSTDIEPTSALRQCASDAGIPWGYEMGEFVKWANNELFPNMRETCK